jgi:peptidyl-prolyl cis-trans isomerase B (cyclophilin B)
VVRPVIALLVALAAASVLAACGGDDEPTASQATSAPAPPTEESGPALPEGCERVSAPRPRSPERERRPRARLPQGETWTVGLETNCGTIEIRLDTARAPRTAASFASLVRRDFYDGLGFHRIAGDPASGPFVIQGGDPLGTGLGGPGYTVVERPPRDLSYTRGTVAMAKTEAEPAGASGSQFFIVTAADAGLPPDYALVGRVSGGEDVVQRIAGARTSADERPLEPIVIGRATLRGSG